MATILSSRPVADARIPVSTGRVSSRDADPATFSAVATNVSAGSEIEPSDSGSGNGGKSSARSVRMWKVALPDTSSTSCSCERSSKRHLGCRQRPDHVEQQPCREHHDALADNLGLERHPQAHIHVGGAQLAGARRRRQLHTRKCLNCAAGRGDPGGGLELAEQRVSLERDLHDEYLRRKVEVIGRIEAVDRCGNCRIEREGCCSDGTGKCVNTSGRLPARRAPLRSGRRVRRQPVDLCGHVRPRACMRGARSRGCVPRRRPRSPAAMRA